MTGESETKKNYSYCDYILGLLIMDHAMVIIIMSVALRLYDIAGQRRFAWMSEQLWWLRREKNKG